MGSQCFHLTGSDPVRIEVFLRLAVTQSGVALAPGRPRSTIFREVRRAKSFGLSTHVADFGQRFHDRCRRAASLARRKLPPDLSGPAWQHLRRGLAAGLSPQEIAGRLRRSCIIPGSHLRLPAYVSHETFYCAIYAIRRDTLKAELVRQFRCSRQGRRPRSRTSGSTGTREMSNVALRPPEVAARIVPWHWEGDLIKGVAGRSAIGTLVERTSRCIILVKLDGLTAKNILDGFSRRLRDVPPSLRRTLTDDQGSEMTLHKTLTKRLRMDVFLCGARSPWQRGSNENADGIIREFLPKGLDLSPFTAKNLADSDFVLNNTPRKTLDFKTPREVFSRLEIDHIAGVALQA